MGSNTTPGHQPQTEDPTIVNFKDFWIFHANMDGHKTHSIDIEAQVALLEGEPDIILLNETKLDEGDPAPTLTGYTLIHNRIRKSDTKGGGIAVFAKTAKAAHVTLLECVENFERCWMMIHTDNGPFLLGCWYQPPRVGKI